MHTLAASRTTEIARWPLGDLWLVDDARPPLAGSGPDLVADAEAFAFEYVPAMHEVRGRRSTRALVVPRERVLAACPQLAGAAAPTVAPSSSARLLMRFLDALAAELPALGEAEAEAAGDGALELLLAAVEPGPHQARDARRAALRGEVRRHVRAHLGDPGLSLESIARAHAVSIRALHVAFEGSGESVMRFVRRERLRRCHQDLRRPDSGSVAEIACRWGLGGSAHFSRAFKREYGCSPSDLRAAALAGQSRGTKRATV